VLDGSIQTIQLGKIRQEELKNYQKFIDRLFSNLINSITLTMTTMISQLKKFSKDPYYKEKNLVI
jgi:hypothetical protein